MKPSDLYKKTPESVTHELWDLKGCYYNHLPELGDEGDWPSLNTNRVEVRTVKYFNFDGRRYWRLATVWFDDLPVMVIQNAGREGDDYHKRFVTDPSLLLKMVDHLRSMMPKPEVLNIVNPDDDIDGLTDFYGNSLGGHFERY